MKQRRLNLTDITNRFQVGIVYAQRPHACRHCGAEPTHTDLGYQIEHRRRPTE